MSIAEVFWRWLLTVIRDLCNDRLDPNWKAEQEQLQKDAAAHQRREAEEREIVAEINQRVADREAAADTLEMKRAEENERIEKSTDLKDLWFPESK